MSLLVELPVGALVVRPPEAALLAKALRLLVRMTEHRDGGKLSAELLSLLGQLDRSVRVWQATTAALDEEGPRVAWGCDDTTAQPPGRADPTWSTHDLIDTAETARILGCSASRVTKLGRDEKLAGVLRGGRWLFERDVVLQRRDDLAGGSGH